MPPHNASAPPRAPHVYPSIPLLTTAWGTRLLRIYPLFSPHCPLSLSARPPFAGCESAARSIFQHVGLAPIRIVREPNVMGNYFSFNNATLSWLMKTESIDGENRCGECLSSSRAYGKKEWRHMHLWHSPIAYVADQMNMAS